MSLMPVSLSASYCAVCLCAIWPVAFTALHMLFTKQAEIKNIPAGIFLKLVWFPFQEHEQMHMTKRSKMF